MDCDSPGFCQRAVYVLDHEDLVLRDQQRPFLGACAGDVGMLVGQLVREGYSGVRVWGADAWRDLSCLAELRAAGVPDHLALLHVALSGRN